MVDDQSVTERALCVLGCRSHSGHPYPADNGYLTCDPCSGRLRAIVGELPALYAAIMDPEVLLYRETTGARAAKGFRSAPPANVHLMSLRDVRTKWIQPGDPHSALNVAWWYATQVRDQRDLRTPTGQPTVESETGTLLFHWDWLMRQPWVVDLAQDMREVTGQLRRAIPGSDPAPKRVGTCTQPLDTTDPAGKRHLCGQALYLPKTGATITCSTCRHTYQGPDLIALHLATQAGPP